MAKDATLNHKLVKEYRSNIDMGNTRETMPYTELLNIRNYLAQKGIDSSIRGIKITPAFILMPRLHGIDRNGSDIKFWLFSIF